MTSVLSRTNARAQVDLSEPAHLSGKPSGVFAAAIIVTEFILLLLIYTHLYHHCAYYGNNKIIRHLVNKACESITTHVSIYYYSVAR